MTTSSDKAQPSTCFTSQTSSKAHVSPLLPAPVIASKGWRGFPEVTSPFPGLWHLCHSWQMLILRFWRPLVLETLPPPWAVSCSASLSLSQGFNLNLSYCNLSPLLLVLSAGGVEDWLFLSSLQWSFTFLRVVLLTQLPLCTKSAVWEEVYLPIAENSILSAIVSAGGISMVNGLCKMNWKLKRNLVKKLTLWEFIYCPLKYKQDYFWLMRNWNKNKQTQLCQAPVLNAHHLGPQKLSSGLENNKISAMPMKLFIIAIWARFSESLSWAFIHLGQLFMHQKIRRLVHLLWANRYGKANTSI